MIEFREKLIQKLSETCRRADIILVLLNSKPLSWLESEFRKNRSHNFEALSEKELTSLIDSAELSLEMLEYKLCSNIKLKTKRYS